MQFSMTKILNDLDVEFGLDDRDVFAYASDLAKALKHSNTAAMMLLVDGDDAGVRIRYTRSANGVEQRRSQKIVYRDGILELVFRSSLPNAKAIKKQIKAILRELDEKGFVLDEERLVSDDTALAELDVRRASIQVRRDFTDVLSEVYATAGSSQPLGIWMANFTLLVTTKTLGISREEFKERKAKTGNFRDDASPEELEQLEAAERVIIARYHRHGAESIKALYQDAKEAMEVFS
jgi:prophage antirepressor-like protein